MLFYGTGHRPTFEGIQYGAAFVGIDDVSVNGVAHFWCECVCVCVCVYVCVSAFYKNPNPSILAREGAHDLPPRTHPVWPHVLSDG